MLTTASSGRWGAVFGLRVIFHSKPGRSLCKVDTESESRNENHGFRNLFHSSSALKCRTPGKLVDIRSKGFYFCPDCTACYNCWLAYKDPDQTADLRPKLSRAWRAAPLCPTVPHCAPLCATPRWNPPLSAPGKKLP